MTDQDETLYCFLSVTTIIDDLFFWLLIGTCRLY